MGSLPSIWNMMYGEERATPENKKASDASGTSRQWCAVAGILVRFTRILGGIYHSQDLDLGWPHDSRLCWVNCD